MNDPALRDQFYRIERRQHLIVVLLVVPYLVGVAEVIGYAVAAALFGVAGTLAFAVVAVRRRRGRNTTD